MSEKSVKKSKAKARPRVKKETKVKTRATSAANDEIVITRLPANLKAKLVADAAKNDLSASNKLREILGKHYGVKVEMAKRGARAANA